MIEKLGITSIFVTHDQDEAIEVSDQIIITNKGRIEQIGTPLEVYQNPETAFSASFFGHPSELPDYTIFHNFEKKDNIDKAFVRPEFIKVTKKDEDQFYKHSAVEGVVEQTFFRGDSIELQIRINDTVITARRQLDEGVIEVGEKVDVFVYRIFVTSGEKAYLLKNTSMRAESVVI